MHFQKLLPEQMQYEDSKDQSVENFMEKYNDGMEDKMKRQYLLELWNTKDLKFVICDTLTSTKRISKILL